MSDTPDTPEPEQPEPDEPDEGGSTGDVNADTVLGRVEERVEEQRSDDEPDAD